ncbi:MAG: 2-oxo acid dehydrogenase subunit E2 [Burkholderiales bacterium]|nr:2-oxo acid dehydrogenase subunit E2 [Burkholderiales bacterium]
MAEHLIKVPDLGEGIAEVELVAWHVAPGDRVKEDQGLADVMTDKANVEIPSPVAGTVVALGGEVGQVMAVGATLIRIEVEGEARGAKRGAAAKAAASAVTAPPAPAAPVVATAPLAPSASPPDERPIASPAVRRRAWELGIDLATVRASGPGDRILQADLDAAPKPAQPSTAPVAAAPRSAAAPAADRSIPVIGVRRKIAQRMQESKRRIPHYSYVEEVDVTEIEALRARLNERHGAARPHLTLLPFLVRALVLALGEHGRVNATFDDEAGVITEHGAVHLGIATQTEAGLMVPVLRDAAAHDLWSAAAEITRLADAARAGRIVRAELSGSTITLTSLGALGGIASTPVINMPEVAIVGVNRIVQRPVWRDGGVVPRRLMNLSSSFDHRVVDGAVAAAFVQALRGRLESPAQLFID